jgi:hypothetical protein
MATVHTGTSAPGALQKKKEEEEEEKKKKNKKKKKKKKKTPKSYTIILHWLQRKYGEFMQSKFGSQLKRG